MPGQDRAGGMPGGSIKGGTAPQATGAGGADGMSAVCLLWGRGPQGVVSGSSTRRCLIFS